jgi:hypothetical protein
MITIEKIETKAAGGCNNCSACRKVIYRIHISLIGGGINFRLCIECKDALIRQLQGLK